MDTGVITDNLAQYTSGAWLTLHLVFISCLCGLMLAIPLAVLRVSRNRWLSGTVGVYTYFFRGTPMLVQLLLIYYGFAQFQWLQDQWQAGQPFWLLFREPYFCALLAFALRLYRLEAPALRGDERTAPVPVQVPLADVRGAVAGLLKDLGKTQFGLRQVRVVQEHPGRRRKAAGHQRGAVRGTDRTDGDDVAKV